MQFYTNPDFIEFFRRAPKFSGLNLGLAPSVRNLQEQRISVCTTCMNRLEDIKRTLPKNIKDNADYGNAEFVLLDYNSHDGLGEWVQQELFSEIKSGRLVYCRFPDAEFFHFSHSRNLSFRIATGDVVTNVDADNYIHPGFLHRINECAAVARSKLLIVPDGFLPLNSLKIDLQGRFAMYRSDLYSLGGFDEDIEGYGYEDTGFAFRAMLARFKIVRYERCYVRDRIVTKVRDKIRNARWKDFTSVKRYNQFVTALSLGKMGIRANPGRPWGSGKVIINFEREMML